jgi:hypothetical protein
MTSPRFDQRFFLVDNVALLLVAAERLVVDRSEATLLSQCFRLLCLILMSIYATKFMEMPV